MGCLQRESNTVREHKKSGSVERNPRMQESGRTVASLICPYNRMAKNRCNGCHSLGGRSSHYDYFHTFCKAGKFLDRLTAEAEILRFKSKYSIIPCTKELGHGGFGTVKEIVYFGNNSVYALKIFNPAKESQSGLVRYIPQRQYYKMSLNEFNSGRKLRESGVTCTPSYKDFLAIPPEQTGGLYLYGMVMELMAERDMCYDIYYIHQVPEFVIQWLKLGSNKFSLYFNIFRQAAEAVDDLHSHGFSHGDLKPENFMRTADMKSKYKLIDFGFTLFHENYPASESTRIRKKCGTEAYLAPEVFRLYVNFDPFQNDMWSLGVILMHIFGVKVFEIADVVDRMYVQYLKLRNFFMQDSYNSTESEEANYMSFLGKHEIYTSDQFPESHEVRLLKSPVVCYLVFRLCDPNFITRMDIKQLMSFLDCKGVRSRSLDAEPFTNLQRICESKKTESVSANAKAGLKGVVKAVSEGH